MALHYLAAKESRLPFTKPNFVSYAPYYLTISHAESY